MASFTFYIVCGVTVVLAYLIIKFATFVSKFKKWSNLSDNIAHLPCHWFYGVLNLISSFKDLMVLQQPLINAGHKMIFFWFGPLRPVISVVDPDTVKTILKSTVPKAKGAAGYSFLLPWIGDGLLISEGEKWERNRKLLTAAFHFEILQPYVAIYNSVTEVFMNNVAETCKNGEFINVFEPVGLATLDTMLQCAFSYHGNVQNIGMNHPYVKSVSRVSKLISQRAVNVFLHMEPIYRLTKDGKEFFQLCDYMHNFSREIIQKRKLTLEKQSESEIKNKHHLDFLDILLTVRDENGKPLSDTEIRDEVDTFLFEGHDTTASAISWCFYALAKYPEIQQQVYDDVKEVLDVSTELKWKDLNEFKYLPMFIKETMRFYSPVPSISRQLIEPMVFDGIQIPKGVIVAINIINLHHNPNIWPDPEKFLPERFDNDAIDGKDPYSFVPFSAGPRNCIGQNFAMNEIKTIISKVVHKFHIEFDDERIPEWFPEIVTRAKNGLYLRFTPRN